MEYSRLLERANLFLLGTYLREGNGASVSPPSGSYRQRIEKADRKMREFFASKFDDPRELDKLNDVFYALTWEYEDVYFEIGLLVGAKIARQIAGKLDELSEGAKIPAVKPSEAPSAG